MVLRNYLNISLSTTFEDTSSIAYLVSLLFVGSKHEN